MNEALVTSLEADGFEIAPGSDLVFPVVVPEDVDGVQRVVQRALRDGLRILPLGLGNSLGSTRPEALEPDAPYQLGLSTRALGGIDYEPGDGTVSAGAGTRMEELAEHVTGGGHRLTPDVPRPGQHTLGGVVGAGTSGPDRLRFGPLRHHVLGTEVVSATGERTKSGGRLVKNVTGYDLHRLHCGSRGTLTVLTRVHLRLFPAPERSCLFTLSSADPRRLLEQEEGLRNLATAPTSTWLTTKDGVEWTLGVLLDGRTDTVRAARESALSLLEGEPDEFEGEAARARSAELRDFGTEDRRQPSLRLTCLPSQIGGGAIDNLRAFCEARDVPLTAVTWPGVAQLDAFLPEQVVEDFGALFELREQVAAAEVHLELRQAPAAIHTELDSAIEPVPLDWMRRLAKVYDPEGVLASPLYP